MKHMLLPMLKTKSRVACVEYVGNNARRKAQRNAPVIAFTTLLNKARLECHLYFINTFSFGAIDVLYFIKANVCKELLIVFITILLVFLCVFNPSFLE